MRKIKFRAWDKKNKEIVDESNLAVALDGSKWWLNYGDSKPTKMQNVDRFIIMQYTGLLDKSGKEIYEGDILRNGDGVELWLVEWVAKDIHCGWSIDLSDTWYLEVIGNIYENPELVKL